jgi:hypothetical protein
MTAHVETEDETVRVCVFAVVASLLAVATSARAQDDGGQARAMTMSASPWMVMTDGAAFGIVNHQGGPSGGDEFRATNWFMAMAMRRAGAGELTVNAMFSLDPATATPRGYRELFQVGESYHGVANVDRQHPHDLLMQASASWRVPLGTAALTIRGGPVGEATLGPVAFMHRASAAENPAAPLGHHTLDSTHITMGVVAAAVDRGPWTVEGSVFNGREPDDNRWDLMDPGPLDSWAARVWYKPSAAWELQASHGLLVHPEALEPGDVRRTTASASWFARRTGGFSAVTVALGRNDTDHGAYHAVLGEATDKRGPQSIYGRFEVLQTELSEREWLTAATGGAVRDVGAWGGWETGIGGDLTVYRVPPVLRASHGDHPISFHVFVRVRPPEGHMGRMWNRH